MSTNEKKMVSKNPYKTRQQTSMKEDTVWRDCLLDWRLPKNQVWHIKSSLVHGQGVFACTRVLTRTIVGEYTGIRRSHIWVGCRRYALSTNKHLIDAEDEDRFPLGHYINHSDRPNTRVMNIYGDDRMYLVTSQPVDTNEEFFINYGSMYPWKSKFPIDTTRRTRSGRRIISP